MKISAIIITILLSVGATFAQNSAVKFNVGKFSEELTGTGKSAINGKAIKNFSEIFSGATHVMWSHDKDNINRVYFETEGKVTRAGIQPAGTVSVFHHHIPGRHVASGHMARCKIEILS